jgi:hypothetical protein
MSSAGWRRRWTTKGLLGIGVAFWLLWFWLTLL